VARVWRIARATVYRHRRAAGEDRPWRRPGPAGGHTDDGLVAAIWRVLAASPVHGAGIARGLRLRHDHGSRYLAGDFQAEIAFLGAESSPAFVREPEGNGCAERFIRTLKENLLWVRRFATAEELRLALLDFRRRYNETWLVERHGYRTPARGRADQLDALATAA
jgi:transposase InsO family protein